MSMLRGIVGGAFQALNALVMTLLALAAIVFGLYIYQNHWSEYAQLPIIKEITGNYQQGLTAIGGLSGGTLQRFLTIEGEVLLSERPAGEVILPSEVATSWTKAAILDKLKFSRAKRKQAEYFTTYIEANAPAAMRDMLYHKVPASVKLAQALLESSAGRSKLARSTNNHFGIKARPNAAARSKIKARQYAALRNDEFIPVPPAVGAYRFHDDHTYDRFETYKQVSDSYARHTQLLTRSCTKARKGCYAWIWQEFTPGKHHDIREAAQRFEPVSGIPAEAFFDGDTYLPYYAACAAGLKMAGYATSPTYHKKITYIIETYELWRFDLDLLKSLERDAT
jgi:flagellum-specific peptidoglycan hydrolase FlgJ